MIEPWVYAVLPAIAVVSGFVDAIAGGGGLILMPAILGAGLPPHLALGTNKLQSIAGTTTAFRNYLRGGKVDWRGNLPSAAVSFLGAAAGALVVQLIRPEALRLVVPILLLVAAAYVIFSPRMTDDDAHQRLSQAGYAPIGGGIGFYDGFFGPGTGSFFVTSLVALRGLGLTRATGTTKMLNAASNLGSLLVFIAGGKVLWLLGLAMALGAMTGGWLGSHFAIRHGARLIRPLLIVISLALTGRLIWQFFSS
ncbi:MAG: TSUP family transporter [Novosphingobium sp.]